MNKHNALLSKLPFWGSCGGFLFSLLLLLVTACSDEGREMAEIQQGIQESDEVELSIRTQIPEMEVGSRAATESITTITAFAFNGTTSESVLIKKVDALLSNPTDTTGTLKIKVPKRTRSIHFVAKNGASYDAGKYTLGETNLQDLLLNKTTTDLHYWGMLTFADAEALNVDNLSLTLYRNMAKVVLTSYVDAENDYIAGFLNYNGNATLIPRDNSGNLGYQANAVTLPEEKGVASHDSPQQGLGTECFLSEHANEEGNRIYAICYIDGKYYKIAFSNSSGVFFPLVRNHLYRIVINQISGGSDSYKDAKNADPINGNVREETMNVTNVSLISYKGNTSKVTVTIPDGVTSLRVTSLPKQFDISSTEVTLTDNVCDVTDRQSVNFTLTLKDAYIGTTGTPTISFSGSGTSINATGTGTVTLNGFMDMYEMYVDNSNLNGSTEYAQFFHTRNNTNVHSQTLTTEYVDAGANSSTLAHNHTSAAINMQNESSITFTIADTRYLTLLVAKSSDAPSINITGTLKDGSLWSTENKAESLTTGKYNFGTDGDITTSGRLIRYTLEPGTYTLQRGNNDYLLYYMRVSKEKPTMTDIVQPTAADYILSWSGGTYADSEGKGYLMVSDAKHIVDQDNKTHTVALKTEDSNLITSLNLSTFTLSNIKLIVATDRYSFYSNSANDTQDHSESSTYTNLENTLQYNAGTYTLSSEIDAPNYKLALFYDKLQLKSVGYEVKNPIMSRLYNSMDSGQQPVDEYTTTDGAWAIGFEMPIVMPTEKGTAIAFDIPDWTKYSSDGDVDVGSGLGVVTVDTDSYQFAPQVDVNNNNMKMVHPRPEWIYKIRWASIAAESIAPKITDDNSDVYFSYKGTIGKQVSIPTTLNVQALDIALDFYVDSSDGGSGQYTNSNLVFGETNFYLKATIPENVPAGTTIVLNKNIEGDVNAVHQYYSHYQSDGITNSWTNEMSFTTVAGKTEYLTCWKFVRSDNRNKNDVNISYTLTLNDESVYKLSGETIANITIKGNHSKQILVAMDNVNNGTATERIEMPFEYTKGGNDQLTVTVTVPDGVGELNIEANDFNVSWTDADAAGNTSGNTYKFANTSGGNKEFILTLKEDSKTPKNESLINFAYAADRWTVAPGVVDLELSEKVTENVVIDCNFNNNSSDGFTLQGQGSVSSNGALVLNNTEDRTNAWNAQAMYATDDIEYGATYTLTFKAKIDEGTTGGLVVAIQSGGGSYTYYYVGKNINEIFNNVQKDDQGWAEIVFDNNINITNSETQDNPTHFMFNFGDLVGTIYIDDLKLVKNN